VKHASVDADESLSAYVERVLEDHLRRTEERPWCACCPSATPRTSKPWRAS